MKMVYTNQSNILVNIAKNLLVSEGIPVAVKNEHVSTGAHTHLAYMEIWVNGDADLAKAKELLAGVECNKSGHDWMCEACHELNDASFEICWHCSADSQH